MAKKTKTPLAKPQPTLPAKPPQKVHHMLTMLSSIYTHHLEKIGGKENNVMVATASEFLADLWRRMRPRDPVEEMLLAQMVLLFVRSAYLSAYADQQLNQKWGRMMHEACDRAGNSFRRMMIALGEYRRGGKLLASIQQANFGNQQIITHGNPKNEKLSNELGCASTTAEIPSHAGRPALPEEISIPGEALAVVNGSKNGSGKEPVKNERAAARAAKCSGDAAPVRHNRLAVAAAKKSRPASAVARRAR